MANSCEKCGQDLVGETARKRHSESSASPAGSTAVVADALTRFVALTESLDCECDGYNGYICTIHADRELALKAWFAYMRR